MAIRSKCDGQYKFNYDSIQLKDLETPANEIIKKIKTKINILKMKMENILESKAYKLFKSESHDYLDILLSEENRNDFILNLTLNEEGIVSIESNIFKKLKIDEAAKSIGTTNPVKIEINKESENKDKNIDEDFENLIIKEKKILDMVDNPKILWNNLLAKIRNLWI